MTIFCTKCGTSNDDGAGFCDSCGTKLRVPLANASGSNSNIALPTSVRAGTALDKTSTVNPKKVAYAGAAIMTILVLGGGGLYFVSKPPAATASTLLSAAKAAYGKETTDLFKRELCLSNIDYSKSTFNAGENDQQTQAWMNALVKAGLYSPPVAVSSGGFFVQTLRQYVATPELEKFRQSTRLCAAKDVEFSEVTDIEKPAEQSLGGNGEPPKVLVVKTKLLLKSLNTAAWMEKPEVRDAFMANINGWEYKDKNFQKQIAESFGLKNNKWTTGIAYRNELQKQYADAKRNTNDGEIQDGRMPSKSETRGFGSTLSNFFKTGHQLKGTWQNSNQGEMGILAGFGAPGPGGIKMTKKMTFTSDSIETDGQSVKCKFETNGKRIKVTPEGQSISLIFNIEDDSSMSINLTGIGTFRYVRTE